MQLRRTPSFFLPYTDESFSPKPEITSLSRKRSDYEHTLNARGSRALDYANYITYETNLHALILKRSKRLGIKRRLHTHTAAYTKRIFSLYERATRKFPGDLSLWISYFEFAKKGQNGGSGGGRKKVVEGVLTRMLRLHPTKSKLWVLAVDYAMRERGDMDQARGYMLRGLRFAKRDREMWISYARLEIIYLAKLYGRRKILGIEEEEEGEGSGEGEKTVSHSLEAAVVGEGETRDDDHGNQEARDDPQLKQSLASDAGKAFDGSNTEESRKQLMQKELGGVPDFKNLLSGSVVEAIFDAATKQFGTDMDLAVKFFDMVADIDIPPRPKILNRILQRMQVIDKSSPATIFSCIRLPVVGIEVDNHRFPLALDGSLERAQEALLEARSDPRLPELRQLLADWYLSFLQLSDLDQDVAKVLTIEARKLLYNEYAEGIVNPGLKV